MEFTAGQQVGWSEKVYTWMLEKYGSGPFEVVRTETVPDNMCGCGSPLTDAHHEGYGECPYKAMGVYDYKPLRESVGHSQYVWLKLSDDEHKFSGAYFTAT